MSRKRELMLSKSQAALLLQTIYEALDAGIEQGDGEWRGLPTDELAALEETLEEQLKEQA